DGQFRGNDEFLPRRRKISPAPVSFKGWLGESGLCLQLSLGRNPVHFGTLDNSRSLTVSRLPDSKRLAGQTLLEIDQSGAGCFCNAHILRRPNGSSGPASLR